MISNPPFPPTLSIPENKNNLRLCILSSAGARAGVVTIFDLMVDGINFSINYIGNTLKNIYETSYIVLATSVFSCELLGYLQQYLFYCWYSEKIYMNLVL